MDSSNQSADISAVDGHRLLPSGQESVSKSIPEIASVDLRTIHGPLIDSNHFTLHYSATGFVAFGCQNIVVVADSKSPKSVAQVLVRHVDPVCAIKWISSSIEDSIDVNLMKLASADLKGNLYVWDVIRGAPICSIPAESYMCTNRDSSNILSIDWTKCPAKFMQSSPSEINSRRYSRDCLIVLYPKNLLVLYDSDSGQSIWRKQLFYPSPSLNALSLLAKSPHSNHINVNCTSFSIDPFNTENMVLTVSPVEIVSHESCSFLVVNDFFSFPGAQENVQCAKYSLFVTDFVQQSCPTSSPVLKLRLLCQPFNLSSGTFESKNSPTSLPLLSDSQFIVELKDVSYSKSRISEVIVASVRVVTIINLKLDQVIATIPLERNSSNLLSVYSCFQRNVIFTCHKSGSICSRAALQVRRHDQHTNTEVIDVTYVTVASSEGIKMSKDTAVAGFSVSPLNETKFCLVLSSGMVIFGELISEPSDAHTVSTLSHLIDLKTSVHGSRIEVKETTRLGSLSRPVIIKSCPPVTKSNWLVHRPLLAVGDLSGSILVYDMKDGSICRDYDRLHGNQVRGIEWSSITCFLSWSYPPVSPISHDIRTTTELMITDISTNGHEVIRKDRNIDSSPIQGVKVSHLKQYFIISFRSDPLEIWDLKSLSLLKVMSSFKAEVTAVEWSPMSSSKKTDTVSTISSEEIKDKDTLQQILPPRNSLPSTLSDVPPLSRENFVISSSAGDLFHYSVENVTVKEVSVIHGDYSHGYLTTIAWKENVVVLGFQDGNLLIWDLKKKESTSRQTHSKEVVRKIKFGPGKGNPNFLVLYKDYLEMWDLAEIQVVSRLNSASPPLAGQESFKAIDVDWIGSDRPVILTSTGLLIVTDLSLTKRSVAMELTKVMPPDTSLNKCNYFKMKDHLKCSSLIHFLCDDGFETADKLLGKCLQSSIITGSRFHYAFWSLVGHHVLGYDNLDHVYETYLNNKSFRRIQIERLEINESVQSGFHPAIFECHLMLGHYQRCVQMLLESDSSIPDKYINNGLKACLISSLQACKRSSDDESTVEPVVKLVAASLIASGAVDDGVELLHLIGKVCDSCRYLQSSGQWQKSIWVAKASLEEDKSCEFLERWCDHLVQEDPETRLEVLIQLSLKQFEKVLVALVNRSDVQTAVMFIKLWRMSRCFPSEESSSIQGTVEFVFSRFFSLLKGNQLSEEVLNGLNEGHFHADERSVN